MMVAAKTMALTGMDLFTSPDHLARARAEFDRRRGGAVYTFTLGNRPPPLDYRK
jgi:aminobenzoyl-glutamate utilization protein B